MPKPVKIIPNGLTVEEFERRVEDELDYIRRQREEARGLLLDMLRAPWSRMSPWAITNACVYLEHPSKNADEDRGCPCGRRKDPR